MSNLEEKGLELQVMKAEVQIAELEFKILERQADIERILAHIELQKKIVIDSKEKLNKLRGK